MGSFVAKVIPDDRLGSSLYDEIVVTLKVTGAKAVSLVSVSKNLPLIVGFDTADFVQASIDALSLSGTSGITASTSFASTAMGTDTLGFVISHGRVAAAVDILSICTQSAGGTPAASNVIAEGAGRVTTALANSNVSAVAISSGGMIYGRVIHGNLDSATAGFVQLRIRVQTK